MKKLLTSTFLLLSVCSFAQVSVDLSVGPALTMISSDDHDYESKIGIQGGGMIHFTLNDRVSLMSGLFLQSYAGEHKVEYTLSQNPVQTVTLETKLLYLNLPVGFRFHANDRLSFLGAFVVGKNLKAEVKGNTNNLFVESDEEFEVNTSLKLGMGFNLNDRFSLDVTYDLGLADVTDRDLWGKSEEKINAAGLLLRYRILGTSK
jgi:hypothetical protein